MNISKAIAAMFVAAMLATPAQAMYGGGHGISSRDFAQCSKEYPGGFWANVFEYIDRDDCKKLEGEWLPSGRARGAVSGNDQPGPVTSGAEGVLIPATVLPR